ncbi:hypothetical protein IMG5_154180 [Ichthyophthirius multifiliis]|uniref:Cyclic nucleotide-binding domain-containing protein n=1 Tax=Ichthyophthirius multifiliis TaxID=5932 RepID=G0QZ25_ICHMU|nr:hypothetical protein IMG5_154180 [Ichthyophthirius multifiliis]EGR29530.1 hypothetical protein IMG5_154180 [Ichthyophthirius multifiliis]|eukprot:XP_004030766.1 hypothetical protein IMG5_154180 [Ichthyophthirius multifiliis]
MSQNIEQKSNKFQSECKSEQQLGFKGAWKQKQFLILVNVKRFIIRILSLSFIRRYNSLTNHQLKVINDKTVFSYIYESQFFQKMLNQKCKNINFQKYAIIKHLVQFIKNHNKVIFPDSNFKIIWNILLITFIIWLTYLIPLYVTFDLIDKSVTQLPILIFLQDILIKFNTAYYKKGLVETSRYQICKNYLKNQFAFDLFILLLFGFIQTNDSNTLLLIELCLIYRISIILSEIEQAVNLQRKQQSIYQLIKLSVLVLYIAHFCGCLYFYVGNQTYLNNEINWIEENQLSESLFQGKYICSLYWAVITMLTVGYGDIRPYNIKERIIVIFITIFSCGIYAYALNRIGQLVQEIVQQDQEFRQNFGDLQQYMKKRNLSVNTQTKVKRYFEYLHQEKHDYSEKGQEMLNDLNLNLKNEVLTELNYQILAHYKIFLLNFSKPFLNELALNMKEKTFRPDDIVWESKDFYSNNQGVLFFIIRGQISQQINNNIFIQNKEEGDFFNEKVFLTDQNEDIQYISTCISTLVMLSKNDFLQVLQKYEQDNEMYFKIKDQVKNLGMFSKLDSKCEICGQFTHCYNQCPQVNFHTNRDKIAFKLMQNESQKRQSFVRKKVECLNTFILEDQTRFNALLQKKEIQESILDYILEYNPLKLDLNYLYEYINNISNYNEHLQNKILQLEQDNNDNVIKEQQTPQGQLQKNANSQEIYSEPEIKELHQCIQVQKTNIYLKQNEKQLTNKKFTKKNILQFLRKNINKQQLLQ